MTTDRCQDSKTLTVIASRCSKFHNDGYATTSISTEDRIAWLFVTPNNIG
jgi:hypothetical protein